MTEPANFILKTSKQKMIGGFLGLFCLLVLILLGWEKFNAAMEANKARHETRNQFAFQTSSLITTLNSKSSLQYCVEPYLDFFDTNLRMYRGWLSIDEQEDVNNLLDQLKGVQFFAIQSEKEDQFKYLDSNDQQMLKHYGLFDNSYIWNIWLDSNDKGHPVIKTFRDEWLKDGYDPDGAGAIEALDEYVKKEISDGKAEKNYYNATASLAVLTDQSLKTADKLFDKLTK